jgi:DNA-directed RNA polymerase subunit E'/Rpb7
MSTELIQRRISLESKHLDSKLYDNIFNKLKTTTKNDCTQEYGYILDIIRIVNIKNHKIGRANSCNIFNIEFEAETLKPEPGKKFRGKVCMIYNDGIFVIIKNKQKMLIPKNLLTDYDFISNTYVNKKTEKTIHVDDEIDVIVTACKYNKKSFGCFGSIV